MVPLVRLRFERFVASLVRALTGRTAEQFGLAVDSGHLSVTGYGILTDCARNREIGWGNPRTPFVSSDGCDVVRGDVFHLHGVTEPGVDISIGGVHVRDNAPIEQLKGVFGPVQIVYMVDSFRFDGKLDYDGKPISEGGSIDVERESLDDTDFL